MLQVNIKNYHEKEDAGSKIR